MAVIYEGKLTLDHNWGDIDGDGSGNVVASGEQIQDLVRTELKGRVGYFYNVNKDNLNNALLGFANEDTYKAWTVKYPDELQKTDEAIGDKAFVMCSTIVSKGIPDPYYEVKLENKYSSDRYISVDGNVKIPVRFTSTYNAYDQTTGNLIITNQSEQGILTVQARQSNSINWDASQGISKLTTTINSTAINDDKGFETVDLTNLLTNGAWEVRMMVKSSGAHGTESQWIYYNVIKTNIKITLRTPWQTAQTNGKIALDFQYEGAFVDKYLNIEVSGVGATTTGGTDVKKVIQHIGEDTGKVASVTIDVQSGDTYRVDAHGIHTIKYWIDIEQNEAYQTTPQYVQIMVATDKTNLNPYIIMNNVKGDSADNPLTNWANENILSYSVYAPNDLGTLHSSFPVKLTFKDATGKEYFSDMKTVNSLTGEIVTVNKDISIEADGDVIAPRLYCESNWENQETQSNLLVTKAFMQFYINNEGDYAPSKGADFIFNPRTRSNSESDTEKVRIYNSATGQAIGESTDGIVDESELVKWVGVRFNDTDGWLQDDQGRKCLRLLDGQQLTIPYQPFSNKINGESNNSINCYTLEMTIATRNIVDNTVPLVRVCDTYRVGDAVDDTINGFELRGNDAYYVPSKEKNRGVLDVHDIMFQEGVKTHIAVNVCHFEKYSGSEVSGVIKPTPDGDLIKTTLSKDYHFIRIYVNGVLNRIVEYEGNPISDELQTPGSGSGTLKRYIVLGNTGVYDEDGKKKSGADLDIYEIRAYKGTYAKDESDILKDYISSLATIDEKKSIVEANDILDATTGKISFAKASLLYNTLLWKPCAQSPDNYARPCGREFGDTKKTSNTYNIGDLEVRILKDEGGKKVLDDKKSGVLNDMWAEGQGTSAMTYYKWNQRYKFSETDVTSKFTPFDPEKGGSAIKELFPLNDADPMVGRLDGKLNWASSMHSHKMGAASLYNDCWKQIVGSELSKLTSAAAFENLDLEKMGAYFEVEDENGEVIEERTPTTEEAFKRACKFTGRSNGYGSCRVAVRQEPFLLFSQPEYKKDADGNPTDTLVDPIYYGVLTWGASKGDKPTFGYDKKFNKNFVMIEGTDNDRQLVMCAVPWDDTHVTQPFEAENDGDPEDDWVVDGGNLYNGNEQFEISMGKDSQKMIGKGWDGKNPCLKMFKDMINFTYLHNLHLNVFQGTYEQLVATDPNTLKTTEFYWVTQGSSTTPTMGASGSRVDMYDLFRYNSNNIDGEAAWVPAGLYDATTNTYAKMNLMTQLQLKSSELIGTDEENNQTFINHRVARFRDGYAKLTGHPYGYDTEYANGIGEYVHTADLQFTVQFLKLIAGTDNWGKNTYIYNTGIYFKKNADGTYKGGSAKYDGLDKFGFFQDDLDTIFEIDNSGQKNKPYYVEEHDIEKVTAGVVDYFWNSQTNALYCLAENAYESEMKAMMSKIFDAMATLGKSPTECFEKYFQGKAQTYFPATVYNQTAELTYVDGWYRGSIEGYGAEDTKHLFLSQCLGDQCQAEREWQKNRVNYISSYASWGNFAPGTGGGGGIAMRSKGYAFKFDLTPHIWLYPVITHGSTDIKYTGTDANPFGTKGRVEAGRTISLSTAADSETQVRLKAIDLYSDIGNFARHTADTQFVLRGSRISDFIVRGTTDAPILFNPSASFSIDNTSNVDNLRNFEISGRVANNSAILNYAINLERLWRLENLDLTATSTTGVTLPDNSNIKSIKLPATVQNLSLIGQESLSTFELGSGTAGYTNLRNVEISNTPFIDTYQFVENCRNAGSKLNSLTLKNINWEEVSIDSINYLLGISNVDVTGVISIDPLQVVDFQTKANLLNKFGNIDNESNGLYIKYTTNGFNTFTAKVIGDTYISKNGYYPFYLSATGNDFVSIDWSLTNNDYATIDNTGTVRFIDKADGGVREATVTCMVTLNDGTEINVNKTVYFREKVAEVGDYVYFDGSLSSPAEYNPNKTVVGVCYYVNGDDRRMVSIDLASPNPVMWGMSGSQFTFAQYGNEVFLISPSTIGLGSLTSNGSTHNKVSSAAVTSKATETDLTTEAYSTSGISAGLKQFPLGTTLPCGQFNTINIIEHRNEMVIKKGLGSSTIPGRTTGGVYSLDEKQDLTDLITKAQSNVQTEASLYPAASYCYAYTPVVKDGEVLNEKFAIHNWYLPSMSELLHIWLCTGTNTTYCGNHVKPLIDAGIWKEPVVWDDYSGPVLWSSNQSGVSNAYAAHFRKDNMRVNIYDSTNGTTNANSATYSRQYIRACAKF